MIINIKSKLDCSFETVVSNFNLSLFKALKPPLMPLKVLRFDGCSTGDEVHLDMGFRKIWKSVIIESGRTENQWYFIDKGYHLPKPLKKWKHTHLVIKLSNTDTLIIDRVIFNTSFRFLDFLICPLLFLQFKIRTPLYKKFFRNINP